VRIDAHCHVSDVWYEPAESLLFQMDRHGVEIAMLTQMLGQYDNTYQQASVARWPDRFVYIGAIDVTADDWDAQLQQLAQAGAWGVRIRPVRGPGPAAVQPAELWSRAQALGLAISCIATMQQLAQPEVAALLRANTYQPVLLEHGAGLGRADQVESALILQAILELAALPNVYVKFPAIGQVEQRPVHLPGSGKALVAGEGFARLRGLINVFGTDRAIWGSDFPVVSTREGYGNALQWTQDSLSDCKPEELAMMFGGTAARLIGRAAA
jgi:L-fuconolactonase